MDKIRIGITHGDLNGIGYEVILKAFADAELADMCIPVLYGSPRAAIFNRKNLDLPTNFKIIPSAEQAEAGVLNMVVCFEEEVKIDYGQPTPESGKAAMLSLKKAVADAKAGLIDALVTAPINKAAIHSEEFPFAGHTEYLEHELGESGDAQMILMNPLMRVALLTTHVPVRDVSSFVTMANVEHSIERLFQSLKRDFLISAPRIAVLGLNPHNGDCGLIGDEEEQSIIPAIKAQREKGVQCFGPYAADGFFGAGEYSHFDAVLAMYHDQGLAPFKALCQDDGVNFTAGLSIVRTSPDHGTAYDIAGKGLADPNSFRQALYDAIDITRNRREVDAASKNPLKVQSREYDFRPRRDADAASAANTPSAANPNTFNNAPKENPNASKEGNNAPNEVANARREGNYAPKEGEGARKEDNGPRKDGANAPKPEE